MGVKSDHSRQIDGIQRAMVQRVVNRTGGVAERMNAAQALLEGHRALHRCAHHLQPRLGITAVASG